MKNKIILIALMALMNTTFSQTFETTKVFLNESAVEKNVMRPSYYFTSITNSGGKANVNAETSVKEYFNESKSKSDIWFNQPFFHVAESANDAGVVISATYNYKTNTNEETNTNELGIKTTTKYHNANLQIFFKFVYKDGSPTFYDTVNVVGDITQAPGPACNNMTLEKAENKVNKSLENKSYSYLSVKKYESLWITFPKIKIKDKALKEEFDNANKLLEEGSYKEAGAFFKKLHNSLNSPESSIALGLCYELVGNYPKAQEYFKVKPDFEIKVRMKQNMKLLEYAKSINIEPDFIDF